MKIFTKFALASAVALLACSNLSYAYQADYKKFDLSKFAYKSKASEKNLLTNSRFQRINRINAMLDGGKTMRRENQYKPDATYPSVASMGDIDGPNGEVWTYTADLTFKEIVYDTDDKNYTDHILLEYKFDIYDSDSKFVGSVHDKMRYEDYEIRAVSHDIVPVITQNFFNDDAKYEIMVGLIANRSKTGDGNTQDWMPNSSRILVYSIGGEKETLEVETVEGNRVTKEFDKPVYRIDGQLGDVLDASTPGNEEFYMTFYDEELPEYGDDDIIDDGNGNAVVSDKFWNNLCKAHISLVTRGKVGSDGKMPEVLRVNIPILAMPGDQENTPFMISFTRNDEAYIFVQQYKEVFFNQYNSPTDDLTMRERNSLVVDLYKVKDGKAEKTQTTEIPFVKDSADRLLFTFMSVGDFRYREDINFGDDGKASFYVTKINYFSDESKNYSFYKYGASGTDKKVLFELADSHSPMADIEGYEPQELFINYKNGEYIFHFIDLDSAEEKFAMSCYLEVDDYSDPDMMTSNIERTKVGDSYHYCVEMKNPAEIDNYTYNRFSWFDANGKFLKMDEVNMGRYVLYAQSYLDTYMLNARLFLSDATQEYMILIKRSEDNTNPTEELLIAQPVSVENPTGKEVLLLTPNEYGVLSYINPYTHLEKPMLQIYYYDQPAGKYTTDVYYLPFDSSAVKEIEAFGSGSSLTFDGVTIFAEGPVSVYDIEGKLIAKGTDSIGVDGFQSGVYIAVAGKEVRKFFIK